MKENKIKLVPEGKEGKAIEVTGTGEKRSIKGSDAEIARAEIQDHYAE